MLIAETGGQKKRSSYEKNMENTHTLSRTRSVKVQYISNYSNMHLFFAFCLTIIIQIYVVKMKGLEIAFRNYSKLREGIVFAC